MRNVAPRSAMQNDAIVQREQSKKNPFAAGVWNDVPASEVPDNGIAYSLGYIPRPYGAEAAGGVVLYSGITLPVLPGRTGYSLTKSGSVVTKTVGASFSSDDIGNWIVYDDGIHERITGFNAGTGQVTVENSEVHAASTAAWVHGPVNATYYHRSANKILLHIDTRLFYADTAIGSYTEIGCVSYRKLANAKSQIREERDYAVIISSTGIFKVNLADTPILYYKINSPNPTVQLTVADKAASTPYGYKYLYALARLTGDSDTRNRMSQDVVIEHETGTTQYNEKGLDYSSAWADRPIGDGSTTYSVLTGVALSAPYDVSSGWTGITNGQFRISIDGVSVNFAVDFSDCKTMGDIADRIQWALRAVHSTITCKHVSDHFVITNPVESGTVSYVSAGDGGTDIGTAIMGLESGSAELSSPAYTKNLAVGNFVVPVDPTETTIPQFHHSHYAIYRTLDYGANSINPITGVGNNEEQFIWLEDVPIAKAFVASRTLDVVTATTGSFQTMDVGSKLRFQDGTEVLLSEYVSATQMKTSTSGTVTSQAAAIGGDTSLSAGIRVLTCSQSGQTVTRTAGSSFGVSDIGKRIFFAGGIFAHITGFTDSDHVTVAETQTIISTGACMDPKMRAFNDVINDDELRARITNFSLRHRFWEPFPESNSGRFVPGFFYVWSTLSKTMYYGHIPSSKEYLIGSHNPDQYTTFKDKIVEASEFPDILIVYCSNSTSGIPTNTFTPIDVNDVLQYFKISGQYVIDHERGLLDPSWLKKLPDGSDWLITNEPVVRIFDGHSFSENLADGRYLKVIQALKTMGSVQYDRWHGVTIFGED